MRRAKTDPRTRANPIVVLTSSGQERDIAESQVDMSWIRK